MHLRLHDYIRLHNSCIIHDFMIKTLKDVHYERSVSLPFFKLDVIHWFPFTFSENLPIVQWPATWLSIGGFNYKPKV